MPTTNKCQSCATCQSNNITFCVPSTFGPCNAYNQQMSIMCYLSIKLVVRRAGTWPSSLIHREAGQHACDITGGKSRSFFTYKILSRIQQYGQGNPFEYDSRHWRHNIHVAPLADNQTFSAATERSIVTTRYLKIAINCKKHNWMQQ